MQGDPKLGRLLCCDRDSRHYLPWPRDLDPLPDCLVCHGPMSTVAALVIVPQAVWDEAVSAWAMEQAR